MSKVRAKFKCINIDAQFHGTENVTFEPRYEDGDEAVNKAWSEATPTGKLEMTITNPALLGHYQAGKQYFIDIELAPEAEQDATPG